MKNLFPFVIISLFLWAALFNFSNGPKFFFYLFSALINLTVLFM